MSDIAIRVEHLSKQYRIGGQRAGSRTFREAITSAVSAPVRWLKGERTKPETIWALDNVTFEVKHGEAVGIIGRNGAGKSTLLKILSQITRPTKGKVELFGRVSSLLEVGTGFHSELTGRENIFLNGAIMGMSRREITRKFDEIVAFSEIDRFLDTPVKHYSSGMYVRLAFAIAAHLEPEILLVDEVLAVGDSAFQKKCLGKMGDVAREGRTVLFISHNIELIRNVCDRTILLVDGKIVADGPTDEVISRYLSVASRTAQGGDIRWDPVHAPGTEDFKLRRLRLFGSDRTKPQSVFHAEHPIHVEIIYQILKPMYGYRLILHVVNQDGVTVFASTDQNLRGADRMPAGSYRTQCTIPPRLLKKGIYQLKLTGGIPNVRRILKGEETLEFTVDLGSAHGSFLPGNWPGVIAPQLDWTKDERIDYE